MTNGKFIYNIRRLAKHENYGENVSLSMGSEEESPENARKKKFPTNFLLSAR